MTNLLTSWCVFDAMTHFVKSWRTWWRHDELGDVMTNFVTSLCFFFFILWYTLWHHSVFFMSCQTFRSNDELFEAMMKLLTLWRTFWHHDVFIDIMTNFWCDKLFDVMHCVALIDDITIILTPGTFWQNDAFCWHPDTLLDLMTNLFIRCLSFWLYFSLFREQNIIKTCFNVITNFLAPPSRMLANKHVVYLYYFLITDQTKSPCSDYVFFVGRHASY